MEGRSHTTGMNHDVYSDFALESNLKQRFGLVRDIAQVIVRAVPVSHTARATVFLTDKKELFAYIDAEARLTLGDVRKIVSRMGLVAELFVPPKGQPRYFDEIATEKFVQIFPARHAPSDDDLAYYRTLAPYQPALVQILSVKDGSIYQFDTDSRSGWRVAAKFAYRRIQTS